ncbi:HK97 family phage prohead protease [Mesorhizobium sp. M0139]|uniref:HK97 family phage prohead protease n=1 Tax=Mesorhizobium sp. M0139 TaxID=2956892 RepID=UPI00333A5BEC
MTTTQRAAAARPQIRAQRQTTRPTMIAGYASTFGVAVNGQYVIAPGAFDRLLERGFSPRMLLEHEGEPVGEWLKIIADQTGLFVVGRVDAAAAIERIEAGDIGLSLGRKVGLRKMIEGGISLCPQVLDVGEISIVSEPGDPLALITEFAIGAGQ